MTTHFSRHARQRWHKRAHNREPIGEAWRAARYCGYARIRYTRLHAHRLVYGYAWREWVFVVRFAHGDTGDAQIITIWPRTWWDREIRHYRRWYAQIHGQEEDVL